MNTDGKIESHGAEEAASLEETAQPEAAQTEVLASLVRTSMWKVHFEIFKFTAVAAIMVIALMMVRKKIGHMSWAQIQEGLNSIPTYQIVLACIITAINFVVLIGYDLIAVRYLKKDLPFRKIMVGAIVGYSFSNVLGWMLGGTAVRFRLYTRWGFSLVEVIAFISILTVTIWLGMFMLAGIAFVSLPVRLPERYQEALYFSPHTYGITFLSCVIAYLLATLFIRKPVKLGGQLFCFPPFKLSLFQLFVSATDFALASLVLYILLPSDSLNYSTVLVSYLGAMIVVVVLHVPGGFGVLEYFVIELLASEAADDSDLVIAVLSALIFFRLIYYFAPFVIALAMYIFEEISWLRGLRGHVRSAPTRASVDSASNI
jgi:uncharacterized membrane protein YbhN (UPF0104 family)